MAGDSRWPIAVRRRAKVDASQSEIVEVYRAHGWLVDDQQARLGGGRPDLLCYHPATKRYEQVECKTGKGTLRPEQILFMERGWPVIVLRSADEAEAHLRATRRGR